MAEIGNHYFTSWPAHSAVNVNSKLTWLAVLARLELWVKTPLWWNCANEDRDHLLEEKEGCRKNLSMRWCGVCCLYSTLVMIIDCNLRNLCCGSEVRRFNRLKGCACFGNVKGEISGDRPFYCKCPLSTSRSIICFTVAVCPVKLVLL